MAATRIEDVQDQVQKFWGNMFMDELRSATMLPSLINKDYQGEIKQLGDTVYVSQINAPEAEERTIGVDSDSFNSSQLSTSRISIQANRRWVASFEFEDLVQLQSQIGAQDSAIRQALMYAVEKKINSAAYAMVNPSTSNPDHLLTGVATLDASQLVAIRTLAADALWLKNKPWYLLASPTYYGHLLSAQTLISSDFVPDAPTVGGQIASQRYGFSILEDNSTGALGVSGKYALAFHPDFMHLVTQQEARFKISDLHAIGKFGFKISVDVVGGMALGIAGDKKHIKVTG